MAYSICSSMHENKLSIGVKKVKNGKMYGLFSDSLLKRIKDVVDNKKQVILFQNRRGYSPVLECNSCGHSPKCINCDVTLTYHYSKKLLKCHYCGYNEKLNSNCFKCNSNDLLSKGFGTEQVELELKEFFPKVRIARLDYDTTRAKNKFKNIINSFDNHEYDVLVGTQMITKGLDFKNVQLVGVLNLDSSMNFPDFRSYERSFQLIQQVSGRAGRSKERGEVIIQTYNSKRVKFNSVEYNGSSQIIIKGSAFSDQDILKLISNLNSKKLIKQASLATMTLPEGQTNNAPAMKGFVVACILENV